MLFRIAVCTALLATSAVASAQTRAPAAGAVFFKDATDCFDMNDENGFPMCVMASSGGAYTATAPYRAVTSMHLPFGKFALTAKVLNYLGGDRPIDPWVVVECQLEDANHVVLDYSSDNYGSHAVSSGLAWDGYSPTLYVATAQNGGIPIVLSGVIDVTSRAGATVSLTCRVQGQAWNLNADGTFGSGPAPIQNIRFHNAQIMAVAAPSITLVK